MFSNSQFDATAAFSGGGFMPYQPSQLDNSAPSLAKNRDRQGLIAVTVKQISEAAQSGDEKSNFIVDGVDVTNVTVVGMIYNKIVRSSDIRFWIDDGTGRVECIRWITENLDTKDMDALEEGTYVRVIGHLQGFQGKKQLSVFSVRPVSNFDEVTCHFIECIHLYLQNSKGQGGILGQSQIVDSSLKTPLRGASNGSQPASINDCGTDGFKAFDKMVLNYLLQPSNIDREVGVHLEELSQQLKVPIDKIKDAIEFLEREGLVYSSIDEYHYKAVEGC